MPLLSAGTCSKGKRGASGRASPGPRGRSKAPAAIPDRKPRRLTPRMRLPSVIIYSIGFDAQCDFRGLCTLTQTANSSLGVLSRRRCGLGSSHAAVDGKLFLRVFLVSASAERSGQIVVNLWILGGEALRH